MSRSGHKSELWRPEKEQILSAVATLGRRCFGPAVAGSAGSAPPPLYLVPMTTYFKNQNHFSELLGYYSCVTIKECSAGK